MTIERNDRIPFIHIISLPSMYKKYGAYNCTTNLSSRSLSYIEDPNSGIKKLALFFALKESKRLHLVDSQSAASESLLYYFMLNIPPLICMSLNKNSVYCILSRS